jgi:nucleoside-diphosphate-sugar epimerase
LGWTPSDEAVRNPASLAQAPSRLSVANCRSCRIIVYKPLPTDDPKQRRPDITRARTLLKWEPKVPLEEGLVKTIDYFRTKVR